MKNNLRAIIEKQAQEKGPVTIHFPEIVKKLKSNVNASNETINRLLRDETSIPKENLIREIASFLNVKTTDLISI